MSSKILFWISGALLSFSIAYSLQKKINSDFFAIVDTFEKPQIFFQNQKLVQFKKTWFYHDYIQKLKKPDLNYLSDFEKKYAINLWELALNERIFYRFNKIYKFSQDEILSILEHECKLFDEILTTIKPDFLVMHEPTLHQHELLYQMCKKIGLKVLLLNQPNISRSIISKNPRKLDLPINFDKISSNKRNFDELLSYKKSINTSHHNQNYHNKFKSSTLDLLKSTIKFLFNENLHIKTRYTHRGRTKFKVLKNEISSRIEKKIRFTFIQHNLETKIRFNDKFIYFPLAVDEERNLLIASPYYTNQIEVIRHIAKSLPIEYKLYVKENPSQSIRYWRKKSEYEDIMDIPNVRLFHPNFSSENLIENCSLVITIAGSSGLDAAFYQKPSIVFADLGYSVLPSVSKLNCMEELPKIIRDSLEKKVNSEDLDKYLAFLHDNSFDFVFTEFENKYNEFFYYNGHYFSVNISESKMKRFLDENQTLIDKITTEFQKRLIV